MGQALLYKFKEDGKNLRSIQLFCMRPWKRKCCSFLPMLLPRVEGRMPSTSSQLQAPKLQDVCENAATCLAVSGTLGQAGRGAAPPPPSSRDQSRPPLPLCHSVPFPVSASSLPVRQGQGSESNEAAVNRSRVSKGKLREKSPLPEPLLTPDHHPSKTRPPGARQETMHKEPKPKQLTSAGCTLLETEHPLPEARKPLLHLPPQGVSAALAHLSLPPFFIIKVLLLLRLFLFLLLLLLVPLSLVV